MPYAFASGWFPAHSPAARGILRYLLGHGARMLGVPRTYARTRLRRRARCRARPGLRPRRLALPRRQRPARPARPQPLRDARRRHDRGHLRLRRGGLRAAGERRLPARDVHAAEHRRKRLVPRDAARAPRPRAARAARRAGRARPRLLHAARLARGRPGDQRALGADELRQGELLARPARRGDHREPHAAGARRRRGCGSDCRRASMSCALSSAGQSWPPTGPAPSTSATGTARSSCARRSDRESPRHR